MESQTVWWPVGVIIALILLALAVLVFGWGMRRRTARFGERAWHGSWRPYCL